MLKSIKCGCAITVMSLAIGFAVVSPVRAFCDTEKYRVENADRADQRFRERMEEFKKDERMRAEYQRRKEEVDRDPRTIARRKYEKERVRTSYEKEQDAKYCNPGAKLTDGHCERK